MTYSMARFWREALLPLLPAYLRGEWRPLKTGLVHGPSEGLVRSVLGRPYANGSDFQLTMSVHLSSIPHSGPSWSVVPQIAEFVGERKGRKGWWSLPKSEEEAGQLAETIAPDLVDDMGGFFGYYSGLHAYCWALRKGVSQSGLRASPQTLESLAVAVLLLGNESSASIYLDEALAGALAEQHLADTAIGPGSLAAQLHRDTAERVKALKAALQESADSARQLLANREMKNAATSEQ